MDEPARGAYRSDRMAVALEIKLNGRKLALGSSSQSTLLGRDFFLALHEGFWSGVEGGGMIIVSGKTAAAKKSMAWLTLGEVSQRRRYTKWKNGRRINNRLTDGEGALVESAMIIKENVFFYWTWVLDTALVVSTFNEELPKSLKEYIKMRTNKAKNLITCLMRILGFQCLVLTQLPFFLHCLLNTAYLLSVLARRILILFGNFRSFLQDGLEI